MKKKIENEKGITLVALVITIIILLILAGISISALTNTGIFQKAKDAKQKSDNAALDQNIKLDEYENEIDKYLEKQDGVKLADKVKVGEYVNYISNGSNKYEVAKENSGATETQTISKDDLRWRVLDITENGEVRLISEKTTTSKISLSGYNGYNNAVKILDDACKTLYNSELAIKVQNLKIEDITKYMKKKLEEDETLYQPENIKYPKILEKEENQKVEKSTAENKLDMSSQDVFVTGGDTSYTSTLKNTYCGDSMTESDFDTGYYELFIENEKKENYNTYWISSRCVVAYSDHAAFAIRSIGTGFVGARTLYNSNGDESPYYYPFRPVITLNTNVQIDSANTGDGTENMPYNIK